MPGQLHPSQVVDRPMLAGGVQDPRRSLDRRLAGPGTGRSVGDLVATARPSFQLSGNLWHPDRRRIAQPDELGDPEDERRRVHDLQRIKTLHINPRIDPYVNRPVQQSSQCAAVTASTKPASGSCNRLARCVCASQPRTT